MNVDLVLKATKVDGVYTAIPKKHTDAMRYERVTYDEALAKRLGVMDATALTLCRDQKLPIRVFSIFKPGSIQARRHRTGRRHAGALLAGELDDRHGSVPTPLYL